ncbi:hypothetical protein Bca4012_091650 [Brassica carinata]|uniref:Uncharacterized protein n=2 Tax=Brassica TaxID=3705 RepID=A0A8X7TX15_BRACI|nr:hypothetical protein Bca52824_074480 [Brassica carinata]
MDYDNKGCQSPPEGPKLCINNCGFFRSDATMNINILKETFTAALVDAETKTAEPMAVSVQPSSVVEEVVAPAAKPKEGPSRCTTCNKRVDIHNCSFNYHVAEQEAIAKANPVVNAEKLDKI